MASPGNGLIAISGKQFSGKDTVADLLVQAMPMWHKVPLARAIKLAFATREGLTLQDIEANKALYREGLITLGQRRRAEDPDAWIRRVLEAPGPKIVPDLRMRHEYDVFKAHGAFLIRVEADRAVRARRGTLVQEDDPTECELDLETAWDARLENNGTPEDLAQAVQALVKTIRERGLFAEAG